MSQAFMFSPNCLKQPFPRIAETMPGPAPKEFIFKNKGLKNTPFFRKGRLQKNIRIFTKKY
jgi:hypothetical protein